MVDVLRPVAIIGSARIPFARSNGAYVDAGNKDMLTAALIALVDKFVLRGETLGEDCEWRAKEWHVARADQDALAYQSHSKAAGAWREGFYSDLVVPFAGLTSDNNIRADTSPEKLAALKPVYDRSAAGTLTAG